MSASASPEHSWAIHLVNPRNSMSAIVYTAVMGPLAAARRRLRPQLAKLSGVTWSRSSKSGYHSKSNTTTEGEHIAVMPWLTSDLSLFGWLVLAGLLRYMRRDLAPTGGQEQESDERDGKEEKQGGDRDANKTSETPQSRGGQGRGRRGGDVEIHKDYAQKVGDWKGKEEEDDGRVDGGVARGISIYEVKEHLDDLGAADGDAEGEVAGVGEGSHRSWNQRTETWERKNGATNTSDSQQSKSEKELCSRDMRTGAGIRKIDGRPEKMTRLS